MGSSNGDFKNGLCSFDCSSCMKSWCCPCLVGRTVGDALEGNGNTCCLIYLLSSCLGGIPLCLTVCQHRVNSETPRVSKAAHAMIACSQFSACVASCVKWTKKLRNKIWNT